MLNVIKFYMLMLFLRVFKDKENKIGKIIYTKFKKIYSIYRGVFKKLYKFVINIYVWLSLVYICVLNSKFVL